MNKNNNYWGPDIDWANPYYYLEPKKNDLVWYRGNHVQGGNYQTYTYTTTNSGDYFKYTPPKKITKEDLM